MRTINKALVSVSAAALLAGGGTMTAATAADSGSQSKLSASSASQVEAAKKKCSKGYVCFYTKANLGGDRCSSKKSFKDWGSKRCRGHKFKSVVNNGTAGHKPNARAYTKPGWKGKVLDIPHGKGANFAKTPVRSVQWY